MFEQGRTQLAILPASSTIVGNFVAFPNTQAENQSLRIPLHNGYPHDLPDFTPLGVCRCPWSVRPGERTDPRALEWRQWQLDQNAVDFISAIQVGNDFEKRFG